MKTEKALSEEIRIIEESNRKAGAITDYAVGIERLLAASREIAFSEGIARCLYLQSRLEQTMRNISASIESNREARKLAAQLELETLVLDCDASEANLLLWNNDLKSAYILALETLVNGESSGNNFAVSMCHYVLGAVSQRYAFDDEALKYYGRGAEISHKNGFLKIEGLIADQLSALFLSRLKLRYAERYALQYARIQQELNSKRGIPRSKLRLLAIYVEEKKLDEVDSLLKEIEGSTTDLLDTERGSLELLKGKLSQNLKIYEDAERYYDSAIKILLETGRNMLIANAFAVLSELKLEQNDPEAALKNAEQSLQHIGTGMDDYLETQAYRLMYEASKAMNNPVVALKYLELYNERFAKQESDLLETRMQFIELDAEYKMKQAEIDEERRRAKELHIELEFKERELTEKTRHLIKQTDSITQFRDDLRAIIRRSPANDPLINEIKERLQEIQTEAPSWDDFTIQFEAAHPIFLAKLQEKHPKLSPMEKKICSMLRLGLTSIDMAKFLSLSERSIENHRYRLRKKLSLHTEKSLQDYLAKI